MPDGSPGDLIRLNYDISGLLQDAIACEDARLSQGLGDLEPGQAIADERSLRGGKPHSGSSEGQYEMRELQRDVSHFYKPLDPSESADSNKWQSNVSEILGSHAQGKAARQEKRHARQATPYTPNTINVNTVAPKRGQRPRRSATMGPGHFFSLASSLRLDSPQTISTDIDVMQTRMCAAAYSGLHTPADKQIKPLQKYKDAGFTEYPWDGL